MRDLCIVRRGWRGAKSRGWCVAVNWVVVVVWRGLVLVGTVRDSIFLWRSGDAQSRGALRDFFFLSQSVRARSETEMQSPWPPKMMYKENKGAM